MAALIPLEDLTKALTVEEIKASIYRVLAITGVSTTVWKPGAVVRTIIAAVAIVLAAMSSLAALLARSGFLTLSSGLWKTLVAFYVFGVTRQEATFATGVVTLANSSGNLYTLDPGDLVVQASVSKKTYTNTTAVVINPVTSDIECTFQADESGSASTAFEGEIDTVVSAYTGVTCSNPDALVGLDAESDELLEASCASKLGALSPNGPSDTYTHFARLATRADGTAIGVTRTRVVPALDLSLDVYLATADGGVDGTQDDASTDLGAVHDLFQRNCVPIPITERTHSATPAPQDVVYSAWCYNTRGLTQAQIETAIAEALAVAIPLKPIGGDVVEPDPGKLYHEWFQGIILGASVDGIPVGVFRADVTTPAGDVTLSSLDAPTIGTVTATAIVQVAPPKGSI